MILDWKRKSENNYEAAFNVAIRYGFCGDCRYTLDPDRCKGFDCYVNSVKVIADALEKQIPKKPVIDLSKSLRDRCPSCGSVIFTLYEDESKFPHCQWCGQKLDWEE